MDTLTDKETGPFYWVVGVKRYYYPIIIGGAAYRNHYKIIEIISFYSALGHSLHSLSSGSRSFRGF